MLRSVRTSLVAFVIVANTPAALLATPDVWDSRLDDLCGLQWIDASPQVPDGQGYWRLKEARFESVGESSGTHNIYVRVHDVNGTPIENQKFFQTSGYNLFDVNESICVNDDDIGTDWTCAYTKGYGNGSDNYYGDIAIWAGCGPNGCNGPYNAYVSETSSPSGTIGLSDKVIGMMMRDPTRVTPGCGDHVNFRFIFEWTIKSGGATTPVISLNPTSLAPSTEQGSSPTSASFTVRNAGINTLNYSITDNAGWLSTSPTSGSSTGEFDTIAVNYSTAGLGVGTHNATITVTDAAANNSPQTIAVTLTVYSQGGGSDLLENFDSMPGWTSEFDGTWGGQASWTITSSGQSGNGLQVSRDNSGSSAKVNVYEISANEDYTISVWIRCPSAASLYWAECAYKLGDWNASNFDGDSGSWTMIQKFEGGGPNGNGDSWIRYEKTFNSGSETQVSVGFKLGAQDSNAPTVRYDTLLIDGDDPPPTDPTISLSKSALSPTTPEGSSPSADSFTVSNSGGGTLSYSVTDNQTWLSVSPTSGTSTGEADTINVTYNTSGLAAGNYNAAITVSAAGATNTPQGITVTLTVNVLTPTIALSTASLSPSCTEGSNASADSFTVRNTGAGTLNYSVSDNQTWLSISPTSGSSTGEADTINVTYTTSGLSDGTHNATITVTDAAATNSPQTIAVTLSVITSAPLVLDNSDFEGDSHTDPDNDHRTANGWTRFSLSGASKSAVPWLGSGSHSPDYCQEIYESNWVAGIYQQVPNASVGNEYRGSVFVRSNGSDLRFWIGIDPAGGTNAASGNVVWSNQATVSDTWTEITVEALATSTTITLFVKAQNPYGVNHYAYIDDAGLIDLGPTLVTWGDDNLDRAVDQQDFGAFQACQTGPDNAIDPGATTGGGHLCSMFDADGDNDIDLADFGRFQRCYSGPGNPSTCTTPAPYPPSP